jgi:hypothetical protein
LATKNENLEADTQTGEIKETEAQELIPLIIGLLQLGKLQKTLQEYREATFRVEKRIIKKVSILFVNSKSNQTLENQLLSHEERQK